MSPKRSDSRPAGFVLAAILLALATQHVHGPASAPALTDLKLPAALTTAVAGVLLVARAVLIRRGLRDRDALEVRPAEDHDPTAEQIQQLAAQLARAHTARRTWRPRPARAVRITSTLTQDGTVRYLLTGPAGSRTALEAALGALADVEIHDAEPPPIPLGCAVVRCELVLARPAHEPLTDQAVDVLGPIATAMARLDPATEAAAVHLDLHVASPARARRLRRRMHRHATPHPALTDTAKPGPRTLPETVERRHDSRGLARKLDPAQPLIEAQLLLRIDARSREHAQSVMRALLSAFDAMAAESHWRAAGQPIPALGFLGSDLSWRRRGFDRRARSGLYRPRRASVLTAQELTPLLGPPTAAALADNIARTPGAIPAPPRGLPSFPGPGVIPLGEVHERTGRRLVGVRAKDTFFSYAGGRSRYGKTETAIGQFVALVREGHGGLFVDPHADALAEIKTYLTDPAVAERVVQIDASDRATSAAAWNLFAVPTRTPQQASARVDAFVDAMATTLGWDERNTRALNLATQSAQALTELALAAPTQDLAPTIFQLPALLSDDTFRQAALPKLTPATAEFFTERFPRLPGEAITAVTNLIDRLSAARQVAALLGRPVSTYDAARALQDDLIVLACPGPGSTRDRLLANLIVYDVLHAARARAAIPPEQRTPFWIFLDELQTYDGPNLPALLEQSAKYGGRGFLLNQNPERLTAPTWNAVSTNRSHLASTTVNARAARMISAEWGSKPGAEVLTRLDRYTYLASVTLGTHVTRPFLVHGVPARTLHAEHHHPDRVAALEQTIDQTTGRTPLDQALTDARAHTQRVRDWLTQPATQTAAAAPAPTRVRIRRGGEDASSPPVPPR